MTKSSIIFGMVWLALAFGIYTIVDNIQNPNKSFRLGNDAQSVTLKRGLDGHYRAEAFINNQKVDVLIDTGATGVAISQAIADQYVTI